MSFLRFFKNITLVIANITIAVTVTPTASAIATLKNPHLANNLTNRKDQNSIAADSSQTPISQTPSSQPMQLPDTDAQNDNWSCGPNSAARVLRYYGHDVDYAMVRAAADKKLFLPQRIHNPFTNKWIEVRTGTPPLTLQQVLQRWEGDRVKRSSQTSFDKLISLVRSGKPAIALVRVGNLSIPYVGTIPALHWIVVTGADSGQIYYTDTNSQAYSLSYQDFQTKWNLGLDKNSLDRDVSGAIANVLRSNGVEARTLVWIDR